MSDLRQRILDCALQLAEARDWESVRLHEIAATLKVNLDDIRQYYRQKDDLVEAWFDRADAAMLEDSTSEDYLTLPPRERLQRSILCWLQALAPHQRLTGEMLLYKLEIGHVHLQVLGLLRVSRTVQWFLEAAHRQTRHVRRALEEALVTSIYLAAFGYWLRDRSAQAERSRRFLEKLLRGADLVLRLDRGARIQTKPPVPQNAPPQQDST